MVRKTIVGFSSWILTVLAIPVAASLIYRTEDGIFSTLGYVWQGPGDITFWLLAILEAYIGCMIALIRVPRWFKLQSIRSIYHIHSAIEMQISSRIISAVCVGLFLGLGFSGSWKLIYLFLYIVY